MSYERITFDIDDHETEQILGYHPDGSVELEIHFDYEPADPSVGIKYESFGIYEVVLPSGKVLKEKDLGPIWDEVNEKLLERVERLREEAELERELQKRGL